MIGGLEVRFPVEGLSAVVIHDGVNVHPAVEYQWRERHVFSLLWVDTEAIGVSYSLAF